MPIVRMRRAQLNRLETEFETKLAGLEAKRGSAAAIAWSLQDSWSRAVDRPADRRAA